MREWWRDQLPDCGPPDELTGIVLWFLLMLVLLLLWGLR